jgi:uncharacterized membrane protein
MESRRIARLSRVALLGAALVFLASGVYFRFANLGWKFFWFDETWNSMLVSGRSYEELEATLFNDREIGREELLACQRLDPARGPLETVRAVAIDDSQHPPLYYFLLRLWAGWLGDSVAMFRTFSVLAGLLAIPLAYGLSLELFGTWRAGVLAALLMAVSPLHVLYAQQARPYAFWTALILASSLALARALRLGRRRDWLLYGVLLAAAFYTHLLSLFVAVAHGLAVAASTPGWTLRPLRLPAPLARYLAATLAAGMALVPWMVVMVSHQRVIRRKLAWMKQDLGLVAQVKAWALDLGSVFLDAVQLRSPPLAGGAIRILRWAPYVAICILVLYALWVVARRGAGPSRWLVLCLAVAPALPAVVPDLVLGGKRSAAARFLIPCYLGAQLAVAHVVAAGSGSGKPAVRRVWRAAAALLLAAGAVSIALNSRVFRTWEKEEGENPPAIARALNECERPLVVASTAGWNAGEMFTLSHLLGAPVRIRFVREGSAPEIRSGASDLFAYNPSRRLEAALRARGWRLEGPVAGTRFLWRMVR